MFSSTIKPYKFVNPSSISVKGGGATIIAGGKKITGGASPQVKSARVTMLAINRIGMAMEGLGKTQQQIRDIIVHENKFILKSSDFNKKREGYKRDQKSEQQSESFGKKEGDSVSKEVVKKEKKSLGWLEKIFGPFAGIISFVGKFVIQQTVLRWMANPNNTKKLVVFVKSFSKVFKWAFNIAYKSTEAVLGGFAKVFGSSDKKGLDRFGEVLGGLGQLLIGIAGFKALGYLLKPWTLVSDILGLVDALNFGGDSGDLPDGPNGKPGGKPNRTPAQLKEAQKRYFNKFGRDAFIKRFGEEGLKNLPRNMQRSALRQFGRNAKAFGIKASQKILGKGVSKALGKIPIIGPVIDFAIRTIIFREPLGKAAASAVGAAIGQGIGGAIGTVGAGALAGGTFGVGLAAAPIIIGASSLIGGFLGDYVGSKLYDWIAPFFSKDKTPQMAKGGIVTKPTKAIIGEKGPEVVIPLSKLGGFGVAATIVGATQSALSRMGAAGEIAKALIGPELAAAENIFGSSKVGGGDTLGKSVTKASKTSLMEVNAGSDISILIGLDNLTIKDTKNPSHNPTTLRGQLANILGALIWVSKKNISGGGGSPGPGAPGPGSAGVSGGSTGKWGALLDLISSKESGGNYEAMYPSTTLKGATKMTISEVARRATGAVGKYQQLPQYLISRAKAAGLNPDKDLYSPENQDKIISVVNIEQNRGGRAWLAGQRSDEAFMQGLSQEFASLPNAQGKFHYSGQSSSHKPSEVRDALKKVKESSIKMAQGGELKKPSSYMSRERRSVIDPQLSKAKQLDKFAAGGAHRVIPDTPSTSWAAGIPLTYVTTSNGKRAEVAVPLAKRFQGFLKELESTGYKINELGGFRPDGPPEGNKDGKGPQYAHPYGAAIDINWTKNPAFVGKRFGDFPRNSAEIASKYGLGWGSKFDDAMHFSAMKREYGAGIDGNEITGKSLGGSKEGADYKPGSSSGSSVASGSTTTEKPESLESIFAKLESAVAGLNTSLGYTPPAKPTTPSAKPTAPVIKPTPAASSSGSKMSKSSEEAARLEEASAAVQGSGQIVPFPINTSVTTSAAFSGQQVYTPRSPITYGI